MTRCEPLACNVRSICNGNDVNGGKIPNNKKLKYSFLRYDNKKEDNGKIRRCHSVVIINDRAHVLNLWTTFLSLEISFR